MRKAKVFDSHGCTTQIHNALIDAIMPQISGNAWKLLSLVIRQTDGWNREEIGLSYRDLIAGLGVASRGTVAAAIAELEPLSLLLITPGEQWEETRYRLNLAAIVEWTPRDFNHPPVTKIGTGVTETPVTEIGTGSASPVPEIVTGTVTEIGTAPVPKIVPINRKESNLKKGKKSGGADAPTTTPEISSDHPAIVFLRALTNRFPKKALWPKIVATLGIDFDEARLRECYTAWIGKGWNEMNFDWLFEWYVRGAIPQMANGAHRPAQADINRGGQGKVVL